MDPPTGPGLLSIRAEADGLSIGVCQTTTATGIRGEFRSDASGDWVPFLEATGSVLIRAGETLDMTFVRDNFDVTLMETVPTSNVQIVVQLLNQAGSFTGIYEVQTTLSSDYWLHNDDTLTADACA
jgi:hypothetical protein